MPGVKLLTVLLAVFVQFGVFENARGDVKLPASEAVPALMQCITSAEWKMSKARKCLPEPQVVQPEELETQDYIQYAYNGGALRLYVNSVSEWWQKRSKKSATLTEDVFAVLVDTRVVEFRKFLQASNTPEYVIYQDSPYTVIIRQQSVDAELFKVLKSQMWNIDELKKHLGPPSFHWHAHGIGYYGIDYVPQGLTFVGGLPDPLQIVDPSQLGMDYPPLSALAELQYEKLRDKARARFAHHAASQQKQIEAALEEGVRSPDGQFTIAPINLGGAANDQQLIIRKGQQPERRYGIGYSWTDRNDYLWADMRTILCKRWEGDRVAFYLMNADTGEETHVTDIDYDDPDQVQFGILPVWRFWYRTPDGVRHVMKLPAVIE